MQPFQFHQSLFRELFSSQTSGKWGEDGREVELEELKNEFISRLLKKAHLSSSIQLLYLALFKSRYRTQEYHS